MKVRWTDRAKQRLKLIQQHIAKDAPLVAPTVIERLIRRSIQIGEFPHSGREVPEYRHPDVREIFGAPVSYPLSHQGRSYRYHHRDALANSCRTI